jgi:hypothetical protein
VHAVAFDGRHVVGVLESQVLTRELGRAADERFPVTATARPLVVRLGVASPAICVRGEVERPCVTGSRNAGVALDAVDSFHHVRPVLERMRRIPVSQAEHPRTRGNGEEHRHRKRVRGPHRNSKVRDIRASAFAS